MNLWSWWPGAKLRDLGILGMNRRNAEFLLVSNPRRLYPMVDDKLRTKALAETARNRGAGTLRRHRNQSPDP